MKIFSGSDLWCESTTLRCEPGVFQCQRSVWWKAELPEWKRWDQLHRSVLDDTPATHKNKNVLFLSKNENAWQHCVAPCFTYSWTFPKWKFALVTLTFVSINLKIGILSVFPVLTATTKHLIIDNGRKSGDNLAWLVTPIIFGLCCIYATYKCLKEGFCTIHRLRRRTAGECVTLFRWCLQPKMKRNIFVKSCKILLVLFCSHVHTNVAREHCSQNGTCVTFLDPGTHCSLTPPFDLDPQGMCWVVRVILMLISILVFVHRSWWVVRWETLLCAGPLVVPLVDENSHISVGHHCQHTGLNTQTAHTRRESQFLHFIDRHAGVKQFVLCEMSSWVCHPFHITTLI